MYQERSSAKLPTRSRTRWLAWLSLALSIAYLSGIIGLLATACQIDIDQPFALSLVPLASGGLAFALLGTLIIHFHPENRIGWISVLIGLTLTFVPFSEIYTTCGLTGIAFPGVSHIYWLGLLAQFVAVSLLFILLPYLFPDGRFLSSRWQAVCWIILSILGFWALITVFLPGPLPDNVTGTTLPIDNPFGLQVIPDSWGPVADSLSTAAGICASLLAIASLVLRWRRSAGDTRQQLKWFAYFLATAVLVQLIFFEIVGAYFYPAIFESWWYNTILLVVFLGFPITIGIAVFKYRLYDIDIIIRKTLVYGALTILLALIYFASVVLLQSVFTASSGQRSPAAIVISTLIIAALFTPLRQRIQGLVDRRFYRRKYDAYQTLAAFAVAARDEVDLDKLTDEVLQVIKDTVQPEYVSLWLKSPRTRGHLRLEDKRSKKFRIDEVRS